MLFKKNKFLSNFFLHNRLENQVLDTYCNHLKIQEISKKNQKASKDLISFLFKCYIFNFKVGIWAIDICICNFVDLTISKIMGRKNPCKRNHFHIYVFFMIFLLQKNVEKKYLSVRLIVPEICFIERIS